jgi:hypothetical protein
MMRNCNILKFFNSFLSAFCLVLATASSTFANNAPGPLSIISLLSLVILIVVLTFAGGGYGILKSLNEVKYTSKLKRTFRNTLEFIAGIVLFFAGIMMSIVGIVGFSIFSIARGVKMVKWARNAEKGGARPAHLEGANPKRLKTAGITLIVLTLLVFGYSMLDLDEVTGISPYKKKGYATLLNDEVKNAYNVAKMYLKENPKAGIVTCDDIEKAGYKPSYKGKISCFSDMAASSGEIRMIGTDSWELKKPVAIITYSGEFTPSEP